jgi:flagellar biosynthetic protein FliR
MKIGFSFLLALILVTTVTLERPAYSDNIYQYAVLVIREFLVGIGLGYVAYLVFTGIYIAGEIIDMQIGFGIVNVMDPMSNIQVPITAYLYFILSMLVFLMVNGHHLLIKALFDSYTYVPLGTAVFRNALITQLLTLFTEMFFTGFKIAAPIVAAVLITDIALGAISRMVPQLNVFVVGMPFKILVGIIIMVVTIPMFMLVLQGIFDSMSSNTTAFLKEIGPK